MFTVHRKQQNPILEPSQKNPWESFAVFNPNPIKTASGTTIIYRALSAPQAFENTSFVLSTIGRARSKDGLTFTDRKPLVVPEKSWERYGCEDPRVTHINGKYFIFYTALSGFPFSNKNIKVGMAISDDLETITSKHLITPFNAKAMALFPEKINGKYTAILSANTDLPPAKMAIAQFNTLDDMLSEEKWNTWYQDIDNHTLNLRRSDNEQVEMGAVPIKTKYGWLVIYSHIYNYMSGDKVFGIEAVLLDLKNPLEIIGRTNGPILVPEENYEKYGIAPNIIFPSGALLEKNILKIYYGGADTVCATAEVDFLKLIDSMTGKRKQLVVRSKLNPILKPSTHTWEQRAVFNPAAIDIDGKITLYYRAMSKENTTVMGYAATENGERITERGETPAYVPREDFERKGVPHGNSGCEDGRFTKIGDKIYMCYTAYNGIESPAVAMTSISIKNFQAKKWTWSKPIIISPKGADDKDACIVDFVKDGKYLFLHRLNNCIVASYIDLEHPEAATDYTTLLKPRQGMWDSLKVGISTPPIKTKRGWLLLYHGVSKYHYKVGLVLLDLKDPTKVIARNTDFILDAQEYYEKEGQVAQVVFPCGVVVRKDKVYIYYGGGDTVVGVATASLEDLLDTLS